MGSVINGNPLPADARLLPNASVNILSTGLSDAFDEKFKRCPHAYCVGMLKAKLTNITTPHAVREKVKNMMVKMGSDGHVRYPTKEQEKVLAKQREMYGFRGSVGGVVGW